MTAYQQDGVTAAQTYYDQADKTALTATFDQKHHATLVRLVSMRDFIEQDLN